MANQLPRLRVPIALLLALLLSSSGCGRDPQKTRDEFLASGDAFAARGKHAEALIEFRNAVQADPQSAQARLKLAEVQLRTGNVGAAAQEFVRAADLQPENADAQVTAGTFLLMLGQGQDAATRARQALLINPRHVRAHILLSGALATQRDFGGALEAVDSAISLAPGTADGYTALGALRISQGAYGEAERALEQAVTVDPESAPARLAFARFLLMTGRLSDAEHQFRTAVERAPRDASANRAMAGLLIALGRTRDAEPYVRAVVEITDAPEARLLLADLYAGTGQPTRAMDLLQPLARQQATYVEASVRLAALEYGQRRTREARARLNDVLSRDRSNPRAQSVLAEFLIQERDFDGALAAARVAAEREPRQWRYHGLLGRIHAARNDPTSAISAYAEALRLQPSNAQLMQELARLHLVSGDTEGAIRFAEDALAAGSTSPDARLVLVRALMSRRDLARAQPAMRALLEQAPGLTAAHVEHGVFSALSGDNRAARAAFQRALEISPRSQEAFSGLAAIELAEKASGAARERAIRWIADAPEDPATLRAAARVTLAAGDRVTAERWLRRSIELDDANDGAYVTLAQLYLAEGRLDDARREFDGIAARTPRPVAALTMSGSILYAQQRVEDAKERFERALRADARAAVAANNLAWIFAEQNQQLDRALQLAQMAKGQLENPAAAIDTLGWVYLKKNLPALAVPLFEENVKRDPKNAVYAYHLGLAYASAGDPSRAREILIRAKSLEATVPGLTEALTAVSAQPAAAGSR